MIGKEDTKWKTPRDKIFDELIDISHENSRNLYLMSALFSLPSKDL